MHEMLESAWDRQGVVSSAKKKVVASMKTQELGAELDGAAGVLGPSVERLLKLIQVTLVVLSKPMLRRKWTSYCWTLGAYLVVQKTGDVIL